MAHGFSSVHEVTEATLRNLCLVSDDVVQGVGFANASAGYHEPVGVSPAGREYGTCVDLPASLINGEFLQRCWDAGLVAFARNAASGWSGSPHIHCVHVGLRDKDGVCRIRSGPRSQIVDFLKDPARDGLASHNLLRPYAPNASTQAEIRKQYMNWVPDYATRVNSPEGNQIVCYAWLEDDVVTCEVAAFLSYFDAKVVGNHLSVSAKLGGKMIDLSKCGLKFDGYHWRGSVRGMWEAVGNTGLDFKWSEDHRSTVVSLKY